VFEDILKSRWLTKPISKPEWIH